MLALEGRQLGNYDVVRRIRVGGMGAVYEGKQRTAFDRRVAIKVILGNYATDRDMRRRFVREARTVARLHHPHILPLIEYGDEQGLLYLVMPFIEGGTLTSYLRRSLPDLHEVTAIYQQLLDAVEYAHDEGLIHRDIKSSNVLLEQRRSGTPYVYLADFGLVRTSRQAELEQAGVPIPLDQVVRTAMAKRMEDRYGSVSELRQAFLAAIQETAVNDDDLPVNEVFPIPGSGRPISTPLLPVEPPAPSSILERRARAVANPALARRGQRVTDDARKNRQRITEPVYEQARRKRFTRSTLAAMIVPVVLLVLLIVPRLLGVGLFPVGVPLVGADPTTTISVIPQSKALQDTFLLTASPQVKNADVTTRIIPDHPLRATAADSLSTPATGTTTIAGVQARGTLLFVNSNDSVISVPLGVTFTSTSGMQVQISQSVDVPARQGGRNGRISTSAVAVMSGTAGNIPAYTLSTKCCNGLTVSNPYPFSGGVNAHQVHVVSQADVNGVSGPLSSQLQQQVLKQLLKHYCCTG